MTDRAHATLSGAELTIKLLARHGVDTLFALSGNGVLAFFDAALDADIRVIDTRHESAAVQAAGGRALCTRKPEVCIVTEGPGLCNALGGIAGLHHDGVPVIVITNCEADDLFGTSCFQEVPQVEAAAPISKWSVKVHDIRQLPDVIARAFREAAAGIPGPVVITLPNQVVHGHVDAALLTRRTPALSKATSATQPSAEFIAQTLALLQKAHKPVILAGAGAFWDGADEPLLRFAEHTGIPVGTCSLGRGLVPDQHPCCFGDGTPGGAPPALMEADTVLVLGERIDHLFAFGQRWAPGATIVQVCAEPVAIARSIDTAASTSADSRAVMAALLSALGPATWPRTDWLARLKAGQAERLAELHAVTPETAAGIHPGQVAKVLQEVAGRDRVTIFDGANGMIWAREYLPVHNPEHFIHMGRLGMIGMGLPYALGARTVHPDLPVILVVGDGSLGFHFMEFETAIRHQLPLVVVVLNDSAWGIEQHFQRRIFTRTTGTALSHVRYDQLAQSLGGFGAYVTKEEELAGVLRTALATGVPAIVNVRTENVEHRTVAAAGKRLLQQHREHQPR